jgi:hypothetical protein
MLHADDCRIPLKSFKVRILNNLLDDKDKVGCDEEQYTK